jgi:uncharacterized protein with HEPN domain
MKDDKLYLIHISECLERIESYVGQMDAKDFANSTMAQDAVLRNLQTMAESTQRLSDKAKESQPQIDWYKIAGFRNILVHDYLGIDVETVWNIIKKELPILKSAIDEMMER